MINQSHGIDEDLYSRQLYVLGHEAMGRLASSSVLISGMGGLGAEIAKNMILCGVKSVTLHDDADCSHSDLSSQFCLGEENVGQNRAAASASKLAELNKHVTVRVHVGKVSEEEFLKKFDTVVLTNTPFEEQIKLSKITHSKDICLIVASARGVFGQVFCDFCENFTVLDKNGESPVKFAIAGITREKDSVVACVDDAKHGLEDCDYVTFTEIQGMTELNDCEPIKVKVLSLDTFSIGDTTKFSPYLKGGIAMQVKKPISLKFKSLEDSFVHPSFLETDSSKPGRSGQLHLAFRSLDKFISDKGHVPRPWNSSDEQDFLTICDGLREMFLYDISDDRELMAQFARSCAGNISPVNSIIGGIAAQEVIKSCSGKFYPVFQWLYFDAVECLPETVPEDFQAIGSRYDGQVAIFGQQFQRTLGSVNLMVVGAGGIGCELMKNAALMGVGAGEGSLLVADSDVVEKSNLNRQFLYRLRHLKKSKSAVAAKAVREINTRTNVYAHENNVGVETEHIYDDEFFESIDVIASAVDNWESRIHLDRQCVYYRKPLIDSGTFGTKGSTQVVVPYLTESYNSSRDPPEKSVPICTIKTFPNAIEHTVQWARDIFKTFFHDSVYNASLYLNSPDTFEELLSRPGFQPVEMLNSVQSALVEDRPQTFNDCVGWARRTWQELFYNQIRQLLINFPPDQVGSCDQPFWSGPKRCPIPLVFSQEDPLHVDFILAAANLKAAIYGVPQNTDRRTVVAFAESAAVPPFAPKTMTVELMDDLANGREESGSTFKFTQLKSQLPERRSFPGLTLMPQQLKIDGESNFHLDFVLAASNLRALNYQIQQADRLTVRLIAGKIVPAVSTTSSVVGGLACLELIKLAAGVRDIGEFRNRYLNLALPFFSFSEPLPAKRQEYSNNEWTIWDRFEIEGEMTLQEFIDYFRVDHSLSITMLTYRVCVLYSYFTNPNVLRGRLKLPMSRLIEEVSKKKLHPHTKSVVFELCCTDTKGKDVEVPYVKYVLAN